MFLGSDLVAEPKLSPGGNVEVFIAGGAGPLDRFTTQHRFLITEEIPVGVNIGAVPFQGFLLFDEAQDRRGRICVP